MSAPHVSCVVVAHDHERFLGEALRSVLAQDWPSLDVVVVDDGSTDSTADVARSFASDGVRLIRQDNQGHLAAFSRGIGEVRGTYIALLDGDDAWLPGKLTRQVGLLEERADVGMVHGDMMVVDDDGRVVHDSYWASVGLVPPRGRILGRLLVGNIAQTSTIVVRSALRDRFHPIPAWARAQDWWIGLRVAPVAGIEIADGPVSRYRVHGGNLWYGSSPERRRELLEREIVLRRRLLADLGPADVSPAEAVTALAELDRALGELAQASGGPRSALAVPTEDERRAWALALARARETGDPFAAIAACALDPSSAHARALLRPVADPDRARVLAGWQTFEARAFVTVADADALAEEPALLRAYTATFDAGDDATLVAIAPGHDPEAALARIGEAFGAAGADPDAGPDVVLLPGAAAPSQATRRAHAILGPAAPPLDALPVLDPAALRVAAERRWAAHGLRFRVTVCAPTWAEAPTWGDLHYARAVAEQLQLRGHSCALQVVSGWEDDVACDVAIHLRGITPCLPRPEQTNVLWNISHPDKLTAAECDLHDLVLTASAAMADRLRPQTATPLAVLEQATDPAVFFPDHDPRFARDLVFVGNSRGVRRRILEDLLPTTHDLAVWGGGWDGLIDPAYVVAAHLPNDDVRKAYASAAIVLNDHWDDMREHGFISNRVFDALAAGAFVISDDVPGLRERFGGALVTYTTPAELRGAVAHYLGAPDERAAIAARGRALVLAEHTFAHRVDALLTALGRDVAVAA